MKKVWVTAFSTTLALAVPVQGAATRDLADAEKTVISEAVYAGLQTKNSLRFRWLPLFHMDGAPRQSYCGYVSQGSSEGETPFVIHIEMKDGAIVSASDLRVGDGPTGTAYIVMLCELLRGPPD